MAGFLDRNEAAFYFKDLVNDVLSFSNPMDILTLTKTRVQTPLLLIGIKI